MAMIFEQKKHAATTTTKHIQHEGGCMMDALPINRH
jgi:hypothetical protein